MIGTLEQIHQNFEQTFLDFKSATALTKGTKAAILASQIDQLSHSRKGLEYLFEKCLDLEEAGLFNDTAWNNPERQVPALVKGTLLSGHPNSSFEILSELRILAYALGHKGTSNLTAEEAKSFLEEAVVLNLEFAFDELKEESRLKITPQERKKIVNHFQFLLEKAELDGIKTKLAEEIRMICEQRPVVKNNVRNLIQTVYHKMDLDEESVVNDKLRYYVNAVYFPSPLVQQNPKYESYKRRLENAEVELLEKEVEQMGTYLQETGLTNPYQAILLLYLLKRESGLISKLLHLNNSGISEWQQHEEYVTELIKATFNEDNHIGIYGLKRMLEQNLFSRRAVRAGLTNLKLVSIHPEVERRILRSVIEPSNKVSPKQYLLGSLIGILGQPNGVGQGNNPSCQSARGISMWAQYTPGKLIDMITTVTSTNNLIMRFEQGELESLKLGKGLVDQLDHNLDAVSVVLVPHLDKIYNEMMNRAANRGEDPHKWTNPAFYGQFVPLGFASPYSYLTNSITNYREFVKRFYALLHPKYNGGQEMVYPNPVGIFITSSKGDMLGFHAVSLLRIAEHNGEYRAYFLNPNNEGRQDWGQGIKPTVYANGEKHGESSLPAYQFIARTYAFHYDNLNVEHEQKVIPKEEIDKVEVLAKEGWGRSYQWS